MRLMLPLEEFHGAMRSITQSVLKAISAACVTVLAVCTCTLSQAQTFDAASQI
jgi:hypothetical protein